MRKIIKGARGRKATKNREGNGDGKTYWEKDHLSNEYIRQLTQTVMFQISHPIQIAWEQELVDRVNDFR